MNNFPCNYFICFINFFFIPIISPYIFFKKSQIKYLKLDYLFFYVVSVILNLILVYIVIIFLNAFHIKIKNDEVAYTVLAIFSALFIAFFYCFVEKYNEFKKNLK